MGESTGFCPYCNVRYVFQPGMGDYVHDCDPAPTEALRNEDVPVMGSWEDYTGSATLHQTEVNWGGAGDTLEGKRAHIEGARFDKVTSRGNRKKTHRTRKHLQYIENPGGEK